MINMKGGKKVKKHDELNFPSFTRECNFKIQYVVNRFRIKIIFASGPGIKYNDKRLRIYHNVSFLQLFSK